MGHSTTCCMWKPKGKYIFVKASTFYVYISPWWKLLLTKKICCIERLQVWNMCSYDSIMLALTCFYTDTDLLKCSVVSWLYKWAKCKSVVWLSSFLLESHMYLVRDLALTSYRDNNSTRLILIKIAPLRELRNYNR